jgi:hypothetical protein
MRAKPSTRYVAASPQTWELIRAAYLSGLSAPTAAARFGVSVGALRKRAAREGWTKEAFARAQTPGSPAAFAPPGDDMALRIEAIVARQLVPLHEEPEAMARRALGHATRAIAEGRGLEAERLVRAARQLRELSDEMPPAHYFWDDEEETDADGRREHMRVMVRSLALRLAEMIAAGKPLPAEFEGLRAERAEDLA